jgi:hypothetical protein
MKKIYAAPSMELFPLETSGAVMNISGNTASPDYGDGYGFGSAATSSPTYGTGANYSASDSDIEELINDILTY